MNAHATVQPAHPAQQRRRVSGRLLLFAVLAAPGAWFLLELGGWAMASYHCRVAAPFAASDLTRASMPAFIVLTLVAFAISLAGSYAAWLAWRRSRDEETGSVHDLAQVGHGRTRFIAWAALIASASFIVGLVFHVIQMWFAPLCGA